MTPDDRSDNLRVVSLTAGYGSHSVVFDISLDFFPGRITAIVGPNGAGKSTILKALFGQAAIHAGNVFYKGRNITGKGSAGLVKAGVAYVPQSGGVFPNLSVADNLKIGS